MQANEPANESLLLSHRWPWLLVEGRFKLALEVADIKCR